VRFEGVTLAFMAKKPGRDRPQFDMDRVRQSLARLCVSPAPICEPGSICCEGGRSSIPVG
jgi:hypothetical protein